MRFGERTIYCQSIHCSPFRLWHCFVGGGKIEERQSDVGIRQPRVSERVVRIFFDRLRELCDPSIETVLCSLIPEIAAFEVKLIGFGVIGVTLCQTLLLFA